MRICIVAEHASKNFGGEAILPVHYFRLLRSLGVESWMVVHARTQNELSKLFPDDYDRILFVPDLWIHKLINHLSGYLPRRLSTATLGLLNQLITQFCQRDIVRRLVREKQINVIHQPIPVAPRFPSALYGLGVPVVIGPLNGGMKYPQAFRRAEPWIGTSGGRGSGTVRRFGEWIAARQKAGRCSLGGKRTDAAGSAIGDSWKGN